MPQRIATVVPISQAEASYSVVCGVYILCFTWIAARELQRVHQAAGWSAEADPFAHPRSSETRWKFRDNLQNSFADILSCQRKIKKRRGIQPPKNCWPEYHGYSQEYCRMLDSGYFPWNDGSGQHKSNRDMIMTADQGEEKQINIALINRNLVNIWQTREKAEVYNQQI
jgi:hypothetical protein